MILKKKVNEDGKVVFEEISLEDAKNVSEELLMFTSDEDKEEYKKIKESKEEKEKSQKEKEKDSNEESVEARTEDDEEDDENTFSKTFSDFGKKMKDTFKGVFSNVKNSNKIKMYKMLAFMEEEDIKKLALDIISGNVSEDKVKLEALYPFLNTNDADEIFLKMLESEKYKEKVISIAPFVSEKILDTCVDKYINGELQDINFDALYPFMDGETIKKLFNYLMKK